MQIRDYIDRGKTFYSCRIWYYKNGQKKSKYKKGFSGKKVAEKWGTKEKDRLEGLRPGSERIKVKDFLNQWLDTKRNKRAPSTISGYEKNIEHINEYIGEMQVSELHLVDIQNMIDKLSNKGLRYNTVKYIYRTLHAALEYACKNEYIIKNACKGVEIKEDDIKFEVKVYSADDLQKLLIALKEQENTLFMPVLLASMRGLRRGECLGLRISDIDFKNKIAYIRNNYIKVKGIEYHRKVKTKESERVIDMSGAVGSIVKEYIERNNKEGRIFTYLCEVDGQLPNPSHISRRLKAFQKANKLPECRFHDLRHTFAMLQIENGTDIDTLKRLLGHSKIGITSDTYLHQNISLMKKASVKLDNIVQCDKIVTFSKDKTDDIKHSKTV